MRLITRQEIAKEFRMPLSSVDSRMTSLGVLPYAPPQRGRGHHVLYDAEEINIALQNERETIHARQKKRPPRIKKKPSVNIYEMSWAQAKEYLTPSSLRQ